MQESSDARTGCSGFVQSNGVQNNRPTGSFIDQKSGPGLLTTHPDMTIRTFLVEDSPVIRDNLIDTLHELSSIQVVGVADDESAAVDWLSSADNDCDLVIIDIFLKRGSGLGVLRAVTDRRRSLVVLSNYLSADMRSKCFELGASALFDKSNEIDALLEYCARLPDSKARADVPV